MKHTVTSVTAQARELAGALPVTSKNCRPIAAQIYGHDGLGIETRLREITDRFTLRQFTAWQHEARSCPETAELRAELRRPFQRANPPRLTPDDWLHLSVVVVLMWQESAALIPHARAFAARLKTEEENA